MLEIIRTTEGTNDGEIWNKETEFVLDGITGSAFIFIIGTNL